MPCEQYSHKTHTFQTIKESPGESKTCTFLVVNQIDQISKIHFFQHFFFNFFPLLVGQSQGEFGWLVTIDKTNNDVFNKMFACDLIGGTTIVAVAIGRSNKTSPNFI